MYLIKVENCMYCVYAANTNNIVAKFARLNDATRYVQYLYQKNHIIENNPRIVNTCQNQVVTTCQDQDGKDLNNSLSPENIVSTINELNKKVNLALEADEVIMGEIDEIKDYFSDLMR